MITNGIWRADPDTDTADVSGAQPPKKLMLSLNGKCNLRCAHCPRGIWAVEAQQASPELVDMVIAEVLPTVRAIRLGGTDLGEQLLAKDFCRFLRAVREYPRIRLEITTNLTHLSDEAAALIAETCHELSISLEGIGAPYQRVRGFEWEIVRGNLDRLARARRDTPSSPLKIVALVTCFRDNLPYLEDVLELAPLGVDYFRYRLFVPNTPEQDGQSLGRHAALANKTFEKLRLRAARLGLDVSVPDPLPLPVVGVPGERWLPLTATVDPLVAGKLRVHTAKTPRRGGLVRWTRRGVQMVRDWMHARRFRGASAPLPSSQAALPKARVCHFPFEVVSILADGTVGTCCEAIAFGMAGRDQGSIQEFWTGARWQALRRAMTEGRYEGACASCSFRKDTLIGA